MTYRTSFSQSNKFKHHPRYWFYEKVLKVPYESDMCYAKGGSILHDALEKYYQGQCTKEEGVKLINYQWEHQELHNSKIKFKKQDYINMFINGVELDKHITNTEMKIFYPDVLGYLDGVNTRDNEIYDWKSSTRRPENEVEYVNQLKFYSWLYYRKFNKLPTKCSVYYLKYEGEKSFIDYTPTMKDVKEVEKEHYEIISQMEKMQAERKLPPVCKTCNFFCPYKEICENDETGTLDYTIEIRGGYVRISGAMTDMLQEGLSKKFSYELNNAFYIKKKNPYANTMIRLYNPKIQCLPIGLLDQALKTLKDYAQYKGLALNLSFKDFRKPNNTVVAMPTKIIGKTLRPYQENAVKVFLDKKIGVLELATGAGKTLVATEIIRRLKTTTLFIVDRKELLQQTKKVFEESLGIEVGVIGNGVKDIKPVTVATIQTLQKNIDVFKDYLSTINFLCLDECHKSSAQSYVKVSRMVKNATYRLNITGTFKRVDGDDMQMIGVCGEIIHKLDSKTLINNDWLVKPKITFINNILNDVEIDHKEGMCLPEDGGDKNYSDYYNEFIVNNDKRNNLVKYVVSKRKDQKVLILVKLVKHGGILEELIPGSVYLNGSTPKKKREKIFDEFAHGGRNVLISTISIFAEGIDIPSLNTIINCACNKSDVKTIQVLGRVLRKNEGKVSAEYIDFMDDTWLFKRASLARRKAFISQGHSVSIMDKDEFIVKEEV